MTDYQTKKWRLTKKYHKADFRLADNDDFFGFSAMPTMKLSTLEKVLYAILIVYFAYFIFEAIKFIF